PLSQHRSPPSRGMADRQHTSRTIRKEPVMGQNQAAAADAAAATASSRSGGRGSGTKKRRVIDACELPPAAKMAVLDEATELPPFGFNIAVLEQRLKRRLGLEIAQSAINACLSPYYNLREWEDRYVVTSLGSEVQEFGSASHPPRFPLEVFLLCTDDEQEADDGGSGGSGGSGGGGGSDGDEADIE
ncbi:unnamed protein product, partial [Ectocarpus sp. 12 AP-2014]